MEEYKYSKKNIALSKLKLTNQLIKLLNKLIKKGCSDIVFSRFPYYTDEKTKSDKWLALSKREGNCVAFAYYMKELLRMNKIKGYIVGGKPPPKFARSGYKDISHAGVVVPYNTGFILFDTAFYFDKIIILDKTNNYKTCKYFTNVYSKSADKWCFTKEQDRIQVYINNNKIDAYYELKELLNPSKSITLHTNRADRTVFRCEVDKFMHSKFYYKINMYNNMLSVSSLNQYNTTIDVSNFFNENGKLIKSKLKTWIYHLNLLTSQKQRMYKDIKNFLSKNYPFVV